MVFIMEVYSDSLIYATISYSICHVSNFKFEHSIRLNRSYIELKIFQFLIFIAFRIVVPN